MAIQLESLGLGKWELVEIPLPSSYEYPPPPREDSDTIEAELRAEMGDIFPEELQFVHFATYGSVVHDGKNAVMMSQAFPVHIPLVEIAAAYIKLAEEKELQGRIPQLYGFMKFPTMDELFLFQEWLDGYEDVGALLKKGKLTQEDIEIITESMLDIVSLLHRLGYVHLDLKLSNFMYNLVTKDLKLIDFESVTDEAMEAEKYLDHISHGVAPPEYNTSKDIMFDHDQMKAIDLYMLGMALLTLQTYDPKYPNGIPKEMMREIYDEGTSSYQNILGYIIAHGKQDLLPLLERDPMKRHSP